MICALDQNIWFTEQINQRQCCGCDRRGHVGRCSTPTYSFRCEPKRWPLALRWWWCRRGECNVPIHPLIPHSWQLDLYLENRGGDIPWQSSSTAPNSKSPLSNNCCLHRWCFLRSPTDEQGESRRRKDWFDFKSSLLLRSKMCIFWQLCLVQCNHQHFAKC